MRRFLAFLALGTSLLLAGCQNPDGSTDWGSTLALGAGAGLAAGLIAGSLSDDDNRGYRRHRHRRQSYGYGYGHQRSHYGYGRPYRHRGYGW
ncbi:hypothetical protein [Teichococcus oryzae]|uniref:Glycine zipper domain-containing protein n=1 Tax=Teichococcus oryzae TaxID=1608942 RepID=A0A5B2TL58_9PROT|nr:hypothetical protein [Pseudoroseomonas oryzae]KAA2214939.1 hypothetical protein F0Q34_04470 [Pseudoroseomonas oryzae]